MMTESWDTHRFGLGYCNFGPFVVQVFDYKWWESQFFRM